MGLFEIDETKICALYHKAFVESGMEHVDPRRYPYLDKALAAYAWQNGCSYEQALIIAKTGKKV